MAAAREKTKPETDYSFFDKYKRRAVQFSPKANEIVATFVDLGADANKLNGVAKSVVTSASLASTRVINYRRGVAVFELPENANVAAAHAGIAGHTEIANSIPVMLDEEGHERFIIPDELTMQFMSGVSSTDAEKIILQQGSTIIERQRTPGYYTVSVPAGKGLFETIRAYTALPQVMFAETSEMGVRPDYLPDDVDFPLQWSLQNTGQTGGTANADIRAVPAWDLQRGDSNVIIAVIDSGADLNHPDLANNFLPRGAEDWDFADPGDPVPDDTLGHGTHVCGIAAAVDNAVGVIGVAHNCRLMPLRIDLTFAGINQSCVDAINYVRAQAQAFPNRRYVINASWHVLGDVSAVHLAVTNAEAANVLLSFAAGNTGGAVNYPARYPEVMAVANTEDDDRIRTTSSRGPEVDVSAPGTDIWSTYPDDSYASLTGTSMSSPHVAGLAALIWSRNSSLTNREVRQIIESTTDNIDALNPGLGGLIGTGRINAYQALISTPISATVVRTFPSPQAAAGSSSGLAYAPDFPRGGANQPTLLFLTQQPFSDRIYFLNPATGAPAGHIVPTGNDSIGCLEFDGTNIRAANVSPPTGWIKSIDPLTGNEVAKIFVPSGRGEGLATDRMNLYYSTETTIYVIDIGSGAVIQAFPAPGGSCRSLALGFNFLFCGNSSSGTITIYDILNDVVYGTIPAPGAAGSKMVEGLGFDPLNGELYVANQSENKIYVLRVQI